MTYAVSLTAAFGCAVCNGVAAILQKVSADREQKVTGLDAGLMVKLFQDVPYLAGIILDILGWMLTFIAVRHLPLFLVESIIAANIAVTALIERVVLHKPLPGTSYITIGFMFVGLILVAVSAAPDTARMLTRTEAISLFVLLATVALAGLFTARNASGRAAAVLAALGGIAFGLTSVASRVLTPAHPLWHNIYSPYIIMLILAGILGIFLFSVALQRAHATILIASMTASQTVVPALIGILLLGDSARSGRWSLVIIGTLLTTGSAVLLALGYNPALMQSAKRAVKKT
jgi:drug/metabolite transporter (DMT)-like permease